MYEGEWENGKHHGHGVKSYADGTRYDGNWYYGKPHGISLLFEGSGRVFKIDFAYCRFVQLLGMWETVLKYKSGVQQEMIERKAADALWKKMTLDQLEKDMHDDDFREFEEAKKRKEAQMLALNDGDPDQMDEADELIAMTDRGSLLSAESSSRMDDDEIRSQVSAASQKLVEMGFSEEAAEAAAKESFARRRAGKRGGEEQDEQDDEKRVEEGEMGRGGDRGIRLPRIGSKR
jgi:hypothetical protein